MFFFFNHFLSFSLISSLTINVSLDFSSHVALKMLKIAFRNFAPIIRLTEAT